MQGVVIYYIFPGHVHQLIVPQTQNEDDGTLYMCIHPISIINTNQDTSPVNIYYYVLSVTNYQAKLEHIFFLSHWHCS